MTCNTTKQPPSGFSHVCHTVVSDVAAALGKEPEELQTPLYDVIDPEALEQLFHKPDDRPDDPTGQVVFEYLGCNVIVYSNGKVQVTPPEEPKTRSSAESGDTLRGRSQEVPKR